MQKPKFKPGQWAAYDNGQGRSGGFGQIIGGNFSGGKWYYSIKGQLTDDQALSIEEDRIVLILDADNEWSVTQ